MDSEDLLFILYTSGSTGKPKGMVHTCGGYMVYTSYTFQTASSTVTGRFIGVPQTLDGLQDTLIFFMDLFPLAQPRLFLKAFRRGRIWEDSGRL